MECTASVAPTGCGTSFSKARMSYLFLRLSGGNKINAQPLNVKIAQSFLNQIDVLFALVLDEVSMEGRKHFAGEDLHHCCKDC
jgi:hypothetical protein